MDNLVKTTAYGAEVIVLPGTHEISEFLVVLWKKLAFGSIKRKGLFSVALSGGNTPRDFYLRLAEEKETSLWESTHLFLADERFVPAVDPDSNYRMIFETLLSRVPIPPENTHSVPVDMEKAAAAALQYEAEIRSFFRISPGELPRFDAVFLGLGTDGHTASLFPGSSVLSETGKLSASVMRREKMHARITLTVPVINNAGNVIFLVMGREKSSVVQKIVEKRDPSLPASLILPRQGRLSFVLDREAASALSSLHREHTI